MAEFEFTLVAAPLLGGTERSIGANRITERDDLAIVSIATPLGGEVALRSVLKRHWRLDSPAPIQASNNAETHAIWTAPDQMLLVFPHTTPDTDEVVQTKLDGAGYTTDQTDNWVIIDVSGPDTHEALERLCPLDLRKFPVGGSGRTVMEHMGAIVLRLDEDRFRLFSASSSAQSFLHAVETSFSNVVD